jgi:hypothetical protein
MMNRQSTRHEEYAEALGIDCKMCTETIRRQKKEDMSVVVAEVE